MSLVAIMCLTCPFVLTPPPSPVCLTRVWVYLLALSLRPRPDLSNLPQRNSDSQVRTVFL